jgi:hypothetical protein
MKSDPHPSWTATVRSIFTITLLLGLLLRRPPSLSLQAAADADGVGVESTKDIPTTVELPSAATADWWTTVQADIRQSEYHITWQEHAHLADQAWAAGAYQAPNRAHNLRTTFTPQGIRVIPRVFAGETPPWEWGLTLIGYGTASTTFSTYDNRVHALGQATLQSKANRIEYRRDLLTEWYVNDERGLEQGFTLHEPPLGLRHAPGENISLHLALRGDLTPHLAAGAEAIEFITSGGVAVLQYDQLSVYDASGRRLPAHLDLVGLSS